MRRKVEEGHHTQGSSTAKRGEADSLINTYLRTYYIHFPANEDY